MRYGDTCSERAKTRLRACRSRACPRCSRGERNFGAAEAAEQRSAEIERRGELAHQRVGRTVRVHVRGIDRDRVRPSSVRRAPSASSSDHITETSVMRGTRCSVTFSLVRIVAAMIGRAAFFAPWVSIEPSSRLPPRQRSIVSTPVEGRHAGSFAAGKLPAAVASRLHGPTAEPQRRYRQREL